MHDRTEQSIELNEIMLQIYVFIFNMVIQLFFT